jgi:hypothetical protein
MAKRDYSCEIMALSVLTALSALSHFWYIMIVICVGIALAGAGFLLSRIYLRARTVMLMYLYSPARGENTRPEAEVPIDVPQGPNRPWPLHSSQLFAIRHGGKS